MPQPKVNTPTAEEVVKQAAEQAAPAGLDMPLLVEPGSPEWQLLQEFRAGRLRQEGPQRMPGYIAFGSEQHMELLGLREAIENVDTLTFKGYALVDMAQYGPMASREYVMFNLMSKVNELQGGKPSIPANAPLPFVPLEKRAEFL